MSRISELENEVLKLKKLLQIKEEELIKLKQAERNSKNKNSFLEERQIPKWAIERYSRQLLVTELGSPVNHISKLMNANVLVVGVGGLGCPASGYLAGAGVGHISLIDYDEVDVTNIHRQLLHSEMTVGLSKVDSAALALRRINSRVRVTPYNILLNSENALDIIRQYDVVLDATDNVVTRYLLNDACVLTGKPLVTASALKMEGQLTIYNHKSEDSKSSGVCMRCVFPVPPPPAAVGSCSQQGVIGPVPGVMGTLQALETIKLLVGVPTISGSMLIFDGMECSFRTVRLRGKNPKCSLCSDNPTVVHLIDYVQFCNAQPSDKDLELNILTDDQRITPKEFHENTYMDIMKSATSCDYSLDQMGAGDASFISKQISSCSRKLLIDVRSLGEFAMCNIPGSINIPIDTIEGRYDKIAKETLQNHIDEVYFLCRRGNDSQIAAKGLMEKYKILDPAQKAPLVKDIVGGLHQWSREVDSNFPIY